MIGFPTFLDLKNTTKENQDEALELFDSLGSRNLQADVGEPKRGPVSLRWVGWWGKKSKKICKKSPKENDFCF